jgi:hypothetical protein
MFDCPFKMLLAIKRFEPLTRGSTRMVGKGSSIFPRITGSGGRHFGGFRSVKGTVSGPFEGQKRSLLESLRFITIQSQVLLCERNYFPKV